MARENHKTYEEYYEGLIRGDFAITAERKDALEKKGVKVALIASENGGNFFVIFNPDSIIKFVREVVKVPGWEKATLETIYHPDKISWIVQNEPWFVYTRKNVTGDAINLQTVVNQLRNNKFLTLRPEFLNRLADSKIK